MCTEGAQEYVYGRYTGSLVFHVDVQISQALIGKGTLSAKEGSMCAAE